MRLPRLASLVPILFAVSVAGAAAAAPVAFVDVTVVPMDQARTLPSHTVVVDGGRIVALGPSADVAVPDGAMVIDGRDRWLMPGLAEMHAHVPPVAQAESLERVLDLFLAHGVTTMRGVLGVPGHLGLRDELERGERAGPRLYTSGPSLNGNTVADATQAVAMVEAQKAAGYDLAKLHPGLSVEVFDALMQTARRVGLPVAGHVPAAVGIEHALAAGMHTIEHMDEYVRGLVPAGEPEREAAPAFFGFNAALAADRARIPVLVEATRRAGSAISPTETLMVSLLGTDSIDALLARPEMQYVPAATRAQWREARVNLQGNEMFTRERADRFLALRRELLRALHEAGVPIVLGSDAPQMFNVPGVSAHRELALMVEAGLSPLQALRTGTIESARHLGANARGLVAVGHDADLLLLAGNPLDDIGHAQRIEGVMVAGRWHDRADLDARLTRVREAVAGD